MTPGPPPGRGRRTLRVWDPVVRGLHAALVAAVGLSALGLVAWFGVHRPAGYGAAAIVLARIVWGFVGPPRARWARFVRGPAATWAYVGAVAARRAPRHLGHNPLGGWMVLALCTTVVGLAISGWLYTTEAWWGDATVEAVHTALAWMLLGLVVLHVAGVVVTGFSHRDNLVAAMLDGKKAAARPGDID